jgi:hypothetical protein
MSELIDIDLSYRRASSILALKNPDHIDDLKDYLAIYENQNKSSLRFILHTDGTLIFLNSYLLIHSDSQLAFHYAGKSDSDIIVSGTLQLIDTNAKVNAYVHFEDLQYLFNSGEHILKTSAAFRKLFPIYNARENIWMAYADIEPG